MFRNDAFFPRGLGSVSFIALSPFYSHAIHHFCIFPKDINYAQFLEKVKFSQYLPMSRRQVRKVEVSNLGVFLASL